MKILLEDHRVADVPVIECSPVGAPRKLPIVLILHGFAGRKEDNFLTAYRLARLGYYAVAIDLHLHGELGAQPFVPSEVSPQFLEVIERSVANLARLVSAYQDHPTADGERMGLLGISLGGAVIHAYLPQRAPQVKTAVAMIAGLPMFSGETFRRIQQVFPQFGVTDDLTKAMQADGLTRTFLENLTDFPLLWLYGKDDPIIPIERVREVYPAVRGSYAHPERFELVEYEGCGHETPPEMYVRALEWLNRHLA